MRANMERHFQDNRTYDTVGTFTTPCPAVGAEQVVGNFTLACTTPTATDLYLTATGSGPTAGSVYTIDQQNVRATTGAPTGSGWTGTCTTAWIMKKGQTC